MTNVLADDVSVSTWAALKTAMATNNSNITLSGNITASSSDTYLEVPQNCTVTLNLNGKTINRNLSSAISSGFVINNNGTLTINGSGKIKGGNNTGYGGGISNGKTLIINGCSIEDNSANYGGGIYIANSSATVTINGGSITGNSSTNGGGGIYYYVSTISQNVYSLRISGKVTITGNTMGQNPNNVFLYTSSYNTYHTIIDVTAALDNDTRIGITKTPSFNITRGLSGNGTVSNFISDNPDFYVAIVASEARIVDHTVDDTQADRTIVYNLPLHPAGTNVTLMGKGTAQLPYQIGSAEQWDAFATIVNDGKYEARGELTADITFTGNHIQPGEDSDFSFYHKNPIYQKQYTGTFDGKGHTITLNQQATGGSTGNKSNWGGLFWHTKDGATIKNLKVAGRILSTINGGSIIQNVQSTGTTIVNCQSSVIFESTASPGGLVGHEHASTTLTIKNSLFDGVFNKTTTDDGGGGFVGKQLGSAVINNSYSIPKSISSNYDSFYSISRPEGNSYVEPTISNCYYLFPSTYTNTVNSQGENASSLSATVICAGLNTEAKDEKNASCTPWVAHNDTVYLATFARYVDIEGWTYGESSKAPTYVGRKGNAAVTLKYKVQGASDATYVTYTPGTTVLNVGNYTLKASVAAVTDSNGEKWNAWESTMDFTVSKATLTVSGTPTATAEYGTQVKDITVSATAVLGETAVAGTWAFPSGNTTVPSVSSTTAYTATFTPTTGAGNYNALTTNITPTITQKAVTVSGITASNKTYDGNTTATLVYTNASFAGKVGSDDLSVSATGQFASKDVGTGKTVTISNLVLAGASAGNYTIESSSQATTTANISKKDVTVSGIIASNKVYDGTNTATTTSGNASFSGLVSGDALTVSTSGTFNDANVGTGKAVTISILSLGGTSADNYKLAASGHQTETTANITQKPLTITAKDQAISYGTTIATGTGQVTTEGLVDGDALTTVELTASTSDYTTNGTITPSDATTTNGIGNYAVTYNDGALTIGKVVLTITAKDKTITYGDSPANDGVTYSGFTGTDDETVLGGTLDYDYSYAQYGDVGDDYTITPKGLTSNNYAITFANGTLTVNPKAATVTPKDGQGKTYGEDDATLTYTSTGLVNGDVFTGVLGRAAGEDVGTYAITQGTIANANYNITFTTGKTFKIDPKTVGITWGETLLTYSGTAQAPEATATGLEDGDDCHVTVTGAKTEVGSYTATASSLDNANYKLPATGLTTDYEIVDQLVLAFAADQQWATWYGVNNYQVPDGMKAYKVTAVSDTKVTVDAINYIPAMTGVLLYREATDAATAKSNAYTGATSSITSLLKSGSPTPYRDYILYGNQFVLSAVSEIGAHRCYLPATGASGSRLLDIDTGDGTTGIYFGYQDASENDRWYDLQGNRIEKPQKKGLFILNGKKVVVK